MRLLLLCAFVVGAFAHPLMVEKLLTNHVVTEDLLNTPMTKLPYKVLLPVVKETVTEMLHTTIPEGCTTVVIPYITMSLLRTYAVHTLRDVTIMLESKTVLESLILDTLQTPNPSNMEPELMETKKVLELIRTKMELYKDLPTITPVLTKISPTELKVMTMFETIMKVYVEKIETFAKTFKITDTILPFERLLIGITTGPIDIQTYWDTLTLEQWLTVVVKEMKALYVTNFNPEICKKAPIPVTTVVTEIEKLVTSLQKVTVDDLVTRLPKTLVMKEATVKTLVAKVLPIIKDMTFVKPIVTILKMTPIETTFMNFVTNFTSEFLVTETIGSLSTMTTMHEFLTTTPELLKPVIAELSKTTDVNKEVLVKLLTKLSVMLRTKGLPLMDIVDVLLKTLDTRVPKLSTTWGMSERTLWFEPPTPEKTERMSKLLTDNSWEITDTEPTITDLFRTIVKKIVNEV